MLRHSGYVDRINLLGVDHAQKVPGLIVAGKRGSFEFQGAKVLDAEHYETAGGQTFAVPGTFHP